jgi:integrase
MKQLTFTSQLAPMMEKYMDSRKNAGYISNSQAYYLLELDDLAKAVSDTPIVTKELIDAWDALKPYLSNRTKVARHNTIRAFAVFAYAHDGTSYVPDTSKLSRNSPFVPHIFSADEIQRIVDAADRLPFRKNAPTRQLVVPAVIRLLYCCGFRVNEVLWLKTEDVDLENGVITVRNGKGGKDRFVPMHNSVTEYLRNYSGQLSDDRVWFFPSAYGHYSSGTIYENFRELLFMSNIPHTGNGPRVHDFRHTYAVHSLEKQLAEGYDPMVIVPRLAAYLGHKSYRETCWYIHLTIVSFPELTEKLDSAFAGIIPVVGGEIREEN